jgi:hypothetical protein
MGYDLPFDFESQRFFRRKLAAHPFASTCPTLPNVLHVPNKNVSMKVLIQSEASCVFRNDRGSQNDDVTYVVRVCV